MRLLQKDWRPKPKSFMLLFMGLFYQKESVAQLPEIVLETQRLFIRPPRIEDWPQWVEVRLRNYKFLQPFEPTWPDKCLSQDFFKRRLAYQRKMWDEDKSQYFILTDKEDGTLIGGINLNSIKREASQSCSFGYWVDERHQGKGYMSEGLKRLITYGFKDVKLHRLNAATLLHNERSRNLLLRCGFIEEGMAEKYLKIDGRWQDHYLFGLPRENWESNT